MRPAVALASLLALMATPALAELGSSCAQRGVTASRLEIVERALSGGERAARYHVTLLNSGREAVQVALTLSRQVSGGPEGRREIVPSRASRRVFLGEERLSGPAPDEAALRQALGGMCRAAPADGLGRS